MSVGGCMYCIIDVTMVCEGFSPGQIRFYVGRSYVLLCSSFVESQIIL